jgi:polysaccharide biosynthesis transport protein
MASLSSADDSAGTMDIWGFLNRRKSFIVLLALVGTGLAYLWFQRQAPLYRTATQIQVIYRGGNMGLYGLLMERNDLEDAQYIVQSTELLKKAIEDPEYGLKDLQLLSGLSDDEAATRIARMLKTGELSANVLEIVCEAGRADEVATIVNAVAEEFVEYHKENYTDSLAELETLLTSARDDLHMDLKQAEKDYQEFRENSRLMSDGSNSSRERQSQFENKVNQQAIRETELLAEIQSLEMALRDDESRESILLMIGRKAESQGARLDAAVVTGDSEFSARTIAQHLFPLYTEEAMLATQVGADHPKLVEIRKRIAFTRKHYQELSGMLPEANVQEAAPDFVAIYLQALRQELLSVQRAKDDLAARAASEEETARSLMKEEIENQNRQNEMARLASLFDSISTQMKETELNSDFGGVNAHVLRRARFGALVYPILSQFLLMGGVAGAFAGLLLGYLVELADHSFRKPDDIVREFGVAIIGHIPFLKEDKLRSVSEDEAMDRTAVSVHLPRSRAAEAYRSVRTAICFSALGSGHRVIQVTSPAAGDGKSTLALNLAVSLAISGKRTLLVESDFRRPKVHKMTGVSNERGIVDVLRERAELDDAIQPTQVADFFVLPCGQRPRNPAELLTRPEYAQLLEVLREKFDYVIIDTPPVLAVTDPCGVAARVDGVVICMRLSRHTRDLGRRSLEQLRDVGAMVTGIVINGVEESDGYGYGSYRYSDYRYYYKNYNYNYRDNSAYGEHDGREDYYSDDNISDSPSVLLPADSKRRTRLEQRGDSETRSL